MKNETLDYGIRAGDSSPPTDANLWLPLVDGERVIPTARTGLRENLAFMAAWVVSALTSPVIYVDPTVESRRSVTSSVVWAVPTTRQKKISLAEAWKQVRRVFDEAEGFRARQREMDARDLPDIVLNENL